MNRDKARKLKPIFDAFCEGQPILRQLPDGTWEETNLFNEIDTFRVKPEVEKVVPYRRYVYRNADNELVVGTAMGGSPTIEVHPSFVRWIDEVDQGHEVLAVEVNASIEREKAIKANQAKGGKK